MQYLPLIAFAAIIVLFLTYAGRQRRKQQALLAANAAAITVGTEVMTTSGLHGTVVARNDDDGSDTVMLAIAPGVEVKWEVAALRDVASLPGAAGPIPGAAPGTPSGKSLGSPFDPPPNRPAD